MDYQALYRKHRPQRFSDIIGQRHVTETLAREIMDGKVAHAYLFAGPRGTGKTTTARILAKALNCPDRGPDGEPDNTCPSCQAVTDGTSLDVIELDAASHNKVEDVREIRVNVGTVASVGGAHRVYILDEAHMLSRAAGNALLKTLEEPPSHVIFVLATTEPYKLLDTIRSRCQRFDFHPVPGEALTGYLGEIAGREGFEIETGADVAITRHAGGSVRDALSLLEQVAALGAGTVTSLGVTRALGLADPDAFGRLAAAVADGDAPAALSLVATLASEGADLRRFVADGISFFRGVFLAQYAPNLEEVVDETAEVIAEWRQFADRLPSGAVLRAVDELGDALMQLREGREERLVVELALLRLTRPETATDAASLVARLDRVEERLRRLAAGPPAEPAPEPEAPRAKPVEPEPVAAAEPAPEPEAAAADDEPETAADAPFAEPEAESQPAAAAPDPVAAIAPADFDLDAFEAVWPALVARVRDDTGPRRNALIREAQPSAVADGVAVLTVPEHLAFHLAQLQEDTELKATVERYAAELLGGAVRVEYRAAPAPHQESLLEDKEEVPQEHDLIDAGDGAIDPADLVKDMLGAEVVEGD